VGVHANDEFLDLEGEADVTHTLAAIRYTGGGSYTDPSVNNQGRYPVRQSFASGTWYFSLIPESTPESDPGTGVAWFERSDDFEVEYDPAEIARLMLGKNYLPTNVFGDSPEPRVQQRVLDALGLEDEVEAGQTYEEQLAELAGADEDEVVDERSRSEELFNDYDRGELKGAVKQVREDADEFSLQGASTEEMAEFLAEQGDDEVEAALQEV
jgi:hypothetical protein